MIASKEQVERTKYWEEYIKKNPDIEDYSYQDEWDAHLEYIREVEKDGRFEEKLNFVEAIKVIREKHKLLFKELEE